MPYAAVNGIRMYYEEAGRGTPLVLLHGATGALGFPESGWGVLLPRFAARHRALAVEHRGHGRTANPAERLSYRQIADDIGAFIERLGLAPAHVAGVSDGGIIALTLGLTRPQLARALVCVGANYRNDAQTRTANAFLDADRLEREHPDVVALLAAVHDAHQGPGAWRRLLGQVRAMVDAEPDYTEADLRRIPTPTLLIAGETDLWGNLEQTLAMRRCIPRSELLILNHAGRDWLANHAVQHSRADVVGPVVLDFLARYDDPASEAAPGALARGRIGGRASRAHGEAGGSGRAGYRLT
jgi:pimeloyl-ACP methyl ester carboxylesterase